ncbi:MAG: class I SAM-dependent methyltransferase [Candidatus Diapherotrites archaeon]|nr:class I SAM-dependent methyltransferase [Candidatus Diapherotrites archaeon]
MDTVEEFYNSGGGLIVDPACATEKILLYWKAEEELLDEAIEEGVTLLDVGSGRGKHLKLLSPRLKKGIGIDVSKPLLNAANLGLAGIYNVAVIEANVKEMPFADGSFDYTLCMFNTLGNILDTEKALKEMARVTKKKIVITSYLPGSLEERKKFYGQCGWAITSTDEDCDRVHTREGFVSWRIEKEWLEESLKELGFNTRFRGLTDIAYACIAEKA